MKRWIISVLFFGCCILVHGQSFIRGKVIDKVTKEPLELAFVKYFTASNTAVTNNGGYFSLPFIRNISGKGDSIGVSFIGYKSQIIPFNGPNDDLLIEMEKGILNLQEVVITPHSSSSSLHTISKIDLNLHPAKSAQDILRIIPGLFIDQHQGGGKAEQIFMRGFDVDHGTDVNISVDGLPVNMVSHAHGQGYADLHFLIPELVGNLDYGKGPYYSPFGNMGTAGYVSLTTVNALDKSTIKLEGGRFNTFRGLAMIDLLGTHKKQKGTNAYIASELLYSDGPFDSPQHFNRFNLFGKLNTTLGRNSKLTLTASTLSSDWDASGQIPARAVRSGIIGRFGAIDNTEGGYTSRTNGSAKLTTYLSKHTSWENQLYYSHYNFNLHSNFSFFLIDPVNGDQIRQRELRNIFGYQSKLISDRQIGDWLMQSTIGAGIRFDHTKNSELSHTINKNDVLGYKQLGNISEANIFLYADRNFQYD